MASDWLVAPLTAWPFWWRLIRAALEYVKEAVRLRHRHSQQPVDARPALRRRLAMEEAGCTVAEIESVLGHQTFKIALKYASQRLRAAAAMAKMEASDGPVAARS